MKRVESTFRKLTSGIPVKAKIPKEAEKYIFAAMIEYSKGSVALHEVAQRKFQRKMCFIFFGYFRKMNWEEFVLALRTRSLRIHKRIAKRLANENNRKYYVVRSTEINYQRFSSRDVKYNKNVRIFGKNVNSYTLTEAADAVIYPKKL